MDTSNLITKGYRVKNKLINICLPDNKNIRTPAVIFIPPEDIKRASMMSTIIMMALITVSIFIPITLVLNFPILFARYAYRLYSYDKAHKFVTSFKCLNCNFEHIEQNYSGKLPIEIKCNSCETKFTVTDPQPEY